ncbi:tryptophan halogenase [Duganella sp. FT80W]|uniref:Tryptophan halogenase n=1 Tax=Duganella guangzhouensis TaxID=2666084 RepID=A0A6I2L3H9_9BURK|nr:tryptophan halogenase family protein [Duganella guangzhouensis]MRW92300.1 tryptophan halogenase [Duganella guangzhouensis]
MDQHKIKNIVIVGGGTAGWMTAAALAKTLKGQYNIKLVESDQIATIGVGEATIPMINLFNRLLGLDEDEFMRQTQGTFKLGIEFVNWGQIGDRYYHGFGVIGQEAWSIDFYQYWLKQYLAGKAPPLDHYALNNVASMHNKFMRARSDIPNSPVNTIVHAYQFDASLYAKFLRNYSEQRDVQRIEGKISDVQLRDADGHISAVVLDDGRKIEGDLFIDCSGFRGLLIDGALHTPYEDWSHWLPCDTAIAVPCASAPELTPYTRATAHSAGWQWRIPLQHRIGNGHVFSSKFMSADEATAILMNNLDGEALAEPRTVRFRTGKRTKAWNKNCVSIGLSCGFIEPLESTSIHLIQTAIAHLITHFPSAGFEAADIREFNRLMDDEYIWARDFVILHYKATERTDSRFWNYCRQMEVPARLQHKIDLFLTNGRVFREGMELFTKNNWIQVMHGQRMRPKSYHPLVDLTSEEEIKGFLDEVETVVANCANAMPTHAEFIAATCAAKR